MSKWWWPHIPDTVYEIDPRPGGQYLISSQAAGIGSRGEFLAVEPDRLHLTWHWMNNGVSQVSETVEVEFKPENGGTRVVVHHDLDDLAGDGEDLRQGWTDVLTRLAAL